jgi:murein DD-endopeptidase MepM/ murein hydrolase activator NlpD
VFLSPDPMTDPSTRPQHTISRRRLLLGLAVGAGAIGASRLASPLGGQLASAVDPELVALTGPGSALETADRLGAPPRSPNPTDTGVIDPPPPGKLIFPLQPGASCGFHDDSYYHPRGTSRTHLALDIMSTAGQPVYAVCDGVLTQRYTNTGTAGWGWVLEDSASNRRYKYFHCAEDANGLVTGDAVRLGDVIGFVGDSGTSVGNFHLHFEVWEGTSRRLDPYPLLDVPDTCTVW